MSRRARVLLFAGLLAACAAPVRRPALPPPPDWSLPPPSLPALQLSQQLHFSMGQRQQRFDALLEIDAQSLRLAAFAAQQPAFRLHWDGQQLDAQQADWLPDEFRPQWVLNDLFLLLAPVEQLRTQLPPEYTLEETASGRTLRWRGRVLASAERGVSRWTVAHAGLGYRLQIDSADAAMRP